MQTFHYTVHNAMCLPRADVKLLSELPLCHYHLVVEFNESHNIPLSVRHCWSNVIEKPWCLLDPPIIFTISNVIFICKKWMSYKISGWLLRCIFRLIYGSVRTLHMRYQVTPQHHCHLIVWKLWRMPCLTCLLIWTKIPRCLTMSAWSVKPFTLNTNNFSKHSKQRNSVKQNLLI